MAKFRVGDLVVPNEGHYIGNTPGSQYNLPRKAMPVVSYIDDSSMRILVDGNESPPVNPACFNHAPQSGPVRTVTSLEIVSGTYGDVRISGADARGVDVHIDDYLDASDLRAAAKLFNELADALAA